MSTRRLPAPVAKFPAAAGLRKTLSNAVQQWPGRSPRKPPALT